MKAYISFEWPITPARLTRDQQNSDLLIARGSGKLPSPPRGVRSEASSHKVSIDWEPASIRTEVKGWRLYQGDESTLIMQIADKETMHAEVYVPSAGVYNFFVSSINSLGKESPKVQTQVTVS